MKPVKQCEESLMVQYDDGINATGGGTTCKWPTSTRVYCDIVVALIMLSIIETLLGLQMTYGH